MVVPTVGITGGWEFDSIVYVFNPLCSAILSSILTLGAVESPRSFSVIPTLVVPYVHGRNKNWQNREFFSGK